jgi:hypothetical protein
MKCAKHPMNDAIAVCPSCGREICEVCRVSVLNVPHCKECAEWMLFQLASASKMLFRMPVPRGIPSRSYFIIGGIGTIIMSIGALVLGIYFFINFGYYGYRDGDFILLFIGSGLLLFGLILTGIGFFGFYKNYSSFMGLISFVFSIIGSVIYVAFTIFSINRGYGSYIGPEYIGAAVIIGICLILMGITFLLVKDFTMVKNLSSATGIYTLIVAGLFCSVFLVLVFGIAWFLLIVACPLMAMVFFLARLPPRYAGHPPNPPSLQQG